MSITQGVETYLSLSQATIANTTLVIQYKRLQKSFQSSRRRWKSRSYDWLKRQLRTWHAFMLPLTFAFTSPIQVSQFSTHSLKGPSKEFTSYWIKVPESAAITVESRSPHPRFDNRDRRIPSPRVWNNVTHWSISCCVLHPSERDVLYN